MEPLDTDCRCPDRRGQAFAWPSLSGAAYKKKTSLGQARLLYGFYYTSMALQGHPPWYSAQISRLSSLLKDIVTNEMRYYKALTRDETNRLDTEPVMSYGLTN